MDSHTVSAHLSALNARVQWRHLEGAMLVQVWSVYLHTLQTPSEAQVLGRLPPNGYNGQNKRYRHKTSPDHGSIYSRHFALNLDDCIKLCQWSQGLCQSVNFGQIRGQNVCELLSVKVTRGDILETWLVNANGWRHVQVVA